MYDVTEYCLSYTVLVSVVQSGAVVTRSSLSQIYTQHCTDSSRTEFILENTIGTKFLALKGEIWVVCCENLKKIDRVMAVPHCFNPFPFDFGALLWVVIIWCYECAYAVMFEYFRIRCALLICTALSCSHKEIQIWWNKVVWKKKKLFASIHSHL